MLIFFLISFRIYSFKEPNNLKNRNTFRYNGLIHPKVVGVEAITNGKGVVFTTGSTKSKFRIVFFCSDISNSLFRYQKTS